MLGDQRLELADHLVVAAEPEVGLDPVLVRDESQLLEPRDRALGEGLVAQVRQSGPAPEGEPLGQQVGGLAERAPAQRSVSLFGEPLEAFRVQLVRIDAQPVRGALPRHAIVHDLAQLRDVDLERVRRRGRRLVAPEVFDQQLGRDGLVPAHEQKRQQGTRLLALDRERRAVQHYLDRAEHPVLQAIPPAAG